MQRLQITVLLLLVLNSAGTAYAGQQPLPPPDPKYIEIVGGLKEGQESIKQQIIFINTGLGIRIDDAKKTLIGDINNANTALGKRIDDLNGWLHFILLILSGVLAAVIIGAFGMYIKLGRLESTIEQLVKLQSSAEHVSMSPLG
jgi:hypothetical protein